MLSNPTRRQSGLQSLAYSANADSDVGCDRRCTRADGILRNPMESYGVGMHMLWIPLWRITNQQLRQKALQLSVSGPVKDAISSCRVGGAQVNSDLHTLQVWCLAYLDGTLLKPKWLQGDLTVVVSLQTSHLIYFLLILFRADVTIVSAPRYGWTRIKSEDVRSQPVPMHLSKGPQSKRFFAGKIGKLPRKKDCPNVQKPGMTGWLALPPEVPVVEGRVCWPCQRTCMQFCNSDLFLQTSQQSAVS